MIDPRLKPIYNQILHFLSLRPRSTYETRQRLHRYLSKANLPLSLATSLITDLQTKHLLNDYDFALWLISSRQRTGKRSKKHVYHELISKHHLPPQLINKAFQEVGFDEKAIIKKIIARHPHHTSLQLTNYLTRKGFSKYLIHQILHSP